MIAGKNGEYSLTRDVDEAFARALADVSKPFAVDSKDDGLSQFQATCRLPDSMAVLNDEELMKHLANVLFCRSTTSPTDDLADSISELSGGLVSSDLRGITQVLSTSSPWGTASIDCDGVTVVSSDTKLTQGGVEPACIPNGIVDHHMYVSTSSLSSAGCGAGVTSSFVPLSSVSTHLVVTSTATAGMQSVPLCPSVSVAACGCTSAKRMSEANSLMSAPADGGTSSLDSLLAPLLHIGSLPALPQVLVSNSGSLNISAPAILPSMGLPSLQTLPDVHTLMKPSRRYVDSRPMVTSGLSALPLASIFTPFSTAFCPPPPVSSSSVIKMDHPLAAATVLATVSVPSCGPSTVCSSALSDSAVNSVVQLTASQTVILPSSLSSSCAVSYQTSLSGT